MVMDLMDLSYLSTPGWRQVGGEMEVDWGLGEGWRWP